MHPNDCKCDHPVIQTDMYRVVFIKGRLQPWYFKQRPLWQGGCNCDVSNKDWSVQCDLGHLQFLYYREVATVMCQTKTDAFSQAWKPIVSLLQGGCNCDVSNKDRCVQCGLETYNFYIYYREVATVKCQTKTDAFSQAWKPIISILQGGCNCDVSNKDRCVQCGLETSCGSGQSWL